jgi:hypothetical protein
MAGRDQEVDGKMKRYWTHALGALTAVGGLAILGPACAHDDSSFFLNAVLAPPQGSANSGCVFTSDPTQPRLSTGVLDVDLVQGGNGDYTAWFLAGNQLITEGNTEQLQTETSRIIIQGAVVTVTLADGTKIPGGTGSYTAPSSGEIDPSAGETPGYSAVSFEIVDPATVTALKNQLPPFNDEWIVSEVKAFGTTIGGDHVESNTFQFPIRVCRGCLILWATDTTMEPQPNCLGTFETTPMLPSICYLGQDVGGVPCTACTSEDPFCLCPGFKKTAANCGTTPACCP